MNKLNVGTIFSGIGAFEQALKKLNIPHRTLFASDNGDLTNHIPENELDKIGDIITKKRNFVKESYLKNYETDKFYDDVRQIDGYKYNNILDILVGGSPCQAFSISGKRGGFNDTRGTLFYEFARIVKESKPKVFIYENVPGLLNHDKGSTWDTCKNVFDDLGYHWDYKIINSKDFGIPQNRKRIFVVGFLNEEEYSKFTFPKEKQLKYRLFDFLDSNIEEKYYLKEKGFKFVVENEGRRTKINSEITKTQLANQQFNWIGDFIFEKEYNDNLYTQEYKGQKGMIRKLTPRECLRLMGFDDSFKIVVPDMKMYKQSGNSIVVNILEEIILEIKKCLK